MNKLIWTSNISAGTDDANEQINLDIQYFRRDR
jgi:hypothetical protein